MLAQKPFDSVQLLVKHVEFAAEFGAAPSLRPRSHDMSFVELHNLDLIALLFLFLSLSSWLVVRALRFSFSVVLKQKRE